MEYRLKMNQRDSSFLIPKDGTAATIIEAQNNYI